MGIIAKVSLTFLQMTTVIPSILFGAEATFTGQNSIQGSILLSLSILNSLINEHMQLACSFEKEQDNHFVRVPRGSGTKLLGLLTTAMFQPLSYYFYPTSFLVYLAINIVVVVN